MFGASEAVSVLSQSFSRFADVFDVIPQSAQAVRSAELARKALLQAEDARRQHQHLADDRHREISSLKRQLEEV